MQPEGPGRVRLAVDEARALSERALAGAGCAPEVVRALADHMLDAALCGYEYSGLPKILNVAEFMAQRPPRGPVQVRRETPMSTLLDGMGHNGMYTVQRATELAIAKAREQGFGLAGVNNTWMSGRGAYFMEQVARAGLVGMLAISSRPQVAPPGAARAAIGTNPISFGFPTEGDPLLVDLGTSALMFTDLALRARRGEALPAGVAIDAAGRPTTDPQAALGGAVLSFGGHKGFALALAMKALGLLAGAGQDPDGAGYLVLAIDPGLMLSPDEYRRELTQALALLRATPRQPGVVAIRLPSDHSHAQRRASLAAGIVVDTHVLQSLQGLAGRVAP